MFILDSLFISGFRWVLDTVVTAADAEMNDDTALREQLLAAEMRREMGEISDEEFAGIETDVLTRIREIKERREGGSGPIAFGAEAAAGGTEFQVEATVSGDFHEPPGADAGTIIEGTLIESLPADRRTNRTRPRRAPRTSHTTRTARPTRKIRKS
jgi:hypothetical protein